MTSRPIRWMDAPEDSPVPEDLQGIRKALLEALERIAALEDEVAGLRGERPARDVDQDDE